MHTTCVDDCWLSEKACLRMAIKWSGNTPPRVFPVEEILVLEHLQTLKLQFIDDRCLSLLC